jgi:hypothetical protein
LFVSLLGGVLVYSFIRLFVYSLVASLSRFLSRAGVGPIKHAPFSVNVTAGEIDHDNWEINWGKLGPDGAVVVAGEERKFEMRARVCEKVKSESACFVIL